MLRRSLVLMALALLAGCGGSKDPEEVVPVQEPVIVEVKNLHALAVTLDVTGNGATYRLGIVHPGMTRTFKIPVNLSGSGPVELVVTPSTNARPYTSGPLLLESARVVDVVVGARLFNSSVNIRP